MENHGKSEDTERERACMHKLFVATIVWLVLLTAITDVKAQSASKGRDEKRGTGAISGRITIGDKPATGIHITLLGEPSAMEKPLMKTVTDSEGQFTFNGLAAGNYKVSPLAVVYVVPDKLGFGLPGKALR